MKKILLSILVATTAFTLSAQKLTIKNILGADYNDITNYDFFNSYNITEVDGSTSTSNFFSAAERIQADYKSPILTGRLRLEVSYENADDEVPNLLATPDGFVHFKPIDQFGIAIGNNFFRHFAIPSAYQVASNITTKYGRLLTDSLGHEDYITTGGNSSSETPDAAFFSHGFSGGLTSSWKFGEDSEWYAKAAAGTTLSFISSETGEFTNQAEYAIDAGINLGNEQLFDFGFTAHDLTHIDRKFGVFAGLTSIENLILNLGFYYNFTSSMFLPETRVTRSDDDGNDIFKYKKQKTKYALGISCGYFFENIGLGISGDIISGLNDEYIDEIEYVNSDGTITEETATIKRGSTIVKYKQKSDGTYKAKRTDEFAEGAIPFFGSFTVNYLPIEELTISFNFMVKTMMNDPDSTFISFCPRVYYNLPNNIGEIAAGIRLNINKTYYDDGISSFSIPLYYTYKYKRDLRK